MLAPGIRFRDFHSAFEDQDRTGLMICVTLDDGGLAAILLT
jgi:hypothetical protein